MSNTKADLLEYKIHCTIKDSM